MGSREPSSQDEEVRRAVDEVLFERELRGLRVPVIARVVLGIVTLAGLLYTLDGLRQTETPVLPMILMIAGLVVVIATNIYFFVLLRSGHRLSFVGHVGCALDVASIVGVAWIVFHFTVDASLSVAVIFKTELPIFLIALVAINALALRARYPIIVGAAGTLVLVIAALTTLTEPTTTFSSDPRQTVSGTSLDLAQLVSSVVMMGGIVIAISFLTATVRRTIRAAVTSEIRRSRLEQNQLQLVLREKVEALGKLVAGVSHEINNPLGVVRSGVDTQRRALGMIEAELPNDSKKGQRALLAASEMLGAMTEALGRIESTEHALRTFAHLDESDIQKVRLDDAIQSVVSVLPPELDALARLRLSLGGDLPEIYVNAREINQMLMTLVETALRSAPEDGGQVWVRTRAVGANTFVDVSDNGPGLDEEAQQDLFDVSLHRQGSRVAADFDLPAALAIAQRHGGDIGLQSQPGQGTTFTVRLPMTTSGPGNPTM